MNEGMAVFRMADDNVVRCAECGVDLDRAIDIGHEPKCSGKTHALRRSYITRQMIWAVAFAEEVVGGPATTNDVHCAFGGPPDVPTWEIGSFLGVLAAAGLLVEEPKGRWVVA